MTVNMTDWLFGHPCFQLPLALYYIVHDASRLLLLGNKCDRGMDFYVGLLSCAFVMEANEIKDVITEHKIRQRPALGSC